MRRIIIAIIASGLYSCSPKSESEMPPPPLAVASILPAPVTTYQQYPASIQGVDNIEIRPQISGMLEQVYIDEGAYVTAGTSLFKIDDRPFKAALSNALANLHAAESAGINADLEIERLTPLVQNKVISDYQLKSAQAAAGVAKAKIDEAKANISQAEINLSFTLIKAPVSGYIGRLEKKRGSLVSPADATALTELSDVHNVHVYFAMSEDDFINFKTQYPGETLTEKIRQLPPVSLLLSDNSAYPAKGHIDAFDGQFNQNTGSITVRANFPNPKGLLRSGNTGKIQLSLLHKEALLVPQSATVEIQEKIFVYQLADSNKIKKKAILIAGRSGHNYVVKEGIKPGDRIVVDEINNLQEGQVINPKVTKN